MVIILRFNTWRSISIIDLNIKYKAEEDLIVEWPDWNIHECLINGWTPSLFSTQLYEIQIQRKLFTGTLSADYNSTFIELRSKCQHNNRQLDKISTVDWTNYKTLILRCFLFSSTSRVRSPWEPNLYFYNQCPMICRHNTAWFRPRKVN